MKIIKNKPFVDETVRLDDHHYDNCQFDSCILVYSGTAGFGLTNSRFADDCEFHLDGVAANTMKAMQALYCNSDWGRKMILHTLQDMVPAVERLH